MNTIGSVLEAVLPSTNQVYIGHRQFKFAEPTNVWRLDQDGLQLTSRFPCHTRPMRIRRKRVAV